MVKKHEDHVPQASFHMNISQAQIFLIIHSQAIIHVQPKIIDQMFVQIKNKTKKIKEKSK